MAPCAGEDPQWKELFVLAAQQGHSVQRGELYDEGATPLRQRPSSQLEHLATTTHTDLPDSPAPLALRMAAARAATGVQLHANALPMAFCERCGSYATAGGQPRGLLNPCHKPKARGREVLTAINQGRNPKAGRRPPRCTTFAPCGME